LVVGDLVGGTLVVILVAVQVIKSASVKVLVAAQVVSTLLVADLRDLGVVNTALDTAGNTVVDVVQGLDHVGDLKVLGATVVGLASDSQLQVATGKGRSGGLRSRRRGVNASGEGSDLVEGGVGVISRAEGNSRGELVIKSVIGAVWALRVQVRVAASGEGGSQESVGGLSADGAVKGNLVLVVPQLAWSSTRVGTVLGGGAVLTEGAVLAGGGEIAGLAWLAKVDVDARAIQAGSTLISRSRASLRSHEDAH